MDQICPKKVFLVWSRKSEHHDWILHIQISLDTKFQLKLTILIFGPNLPKNGYLRPKSVESDHHHWIVHIRTIHGTKMQFNGQFWIFGPNFHNKYDFFIFSIYQAMHAALINFRNNRKSENSKTLKILPLWRKYTIAWPKIRKLWVNLKKCERRKKAIPRQLIVL